MKKYNGIGLTPVFHSEIASSFLLYDILKDHKQIASQLIQKDFNLLPGRIIVERERLYPKKGSIDIFIEFTSAGKKYALLIEVKVHDYLSASDGQIATYYNAAFDDGAYDAVYFIYLTQFTDEDDFEGIAVPKTLAEARRGQELIGDRFIHVSWEQIHQFLTKYSEVLTEEQQLMVSLHRQWVTEKSRVDMEGNRIDVGERALDDYFYDIEMDIRDALPFGGETFENKRHLWQLDVSTLDREQLNAVIGVIRDYAGSAAVNKLKRYRTEETTSQAAKEFLTQLAQSTGEWTMLSFYSELFLLAEEASYLKFYGTGTRGFSIRLEIQGKGEISLCTIYKNRTLCFSLKR